MSSSTNKKSWELYLWHRDKQTHMTAKNPDDGQVNKEFFAPDCFHFSQWGHALVSSWLWKNILEPVGAKTTKGSADEPSLPLACPDPACPFIRTNANSKDCSEYLTPTAGN
ncbi:hypothetical protein ANCDUO_19551 [Ancylostoma duodenale]|uniref:Uncharacterized protein n=1 Tax=Ancylostoma duodenale TaxID=51022 RepID=A0A0C2FZZ7_9BILA|nr:hypothetical protein ANCDUO_19551 [Ancylostoma duodenale]